MSSPTLSLEDKIHIDEVTQKLMTLGFDAARAGELAREQLEKSKEEKHLEELKGNLIALGFDEVRAIQLANEQLAAHKCSAAASPASSPAAASPPTSVKASAPLPPNRNLSDFLGVSSIHNFCFSPFDKSSFSGPIRASTIADFSNNTEPFKCWKCF
jgi:hypothetical protein